jgi:RNA polymerase sigma-70 factor, ECF subfamily
VSLSDDRDMAPGSAAEGAARSPILALYDDALDQVYGYLVARCGRTVAEDLTAETFLAAVDAARAGRGTVIGVPWIMGVARHKLVDHWRRLEREDRRLRLLAAPDVTALTDPWDAELDAVRARDTLGRLGVANRAALTLRYLDDLPVPEVAALLGRTVHATEALLVRARIAFRRAYDDEEVVGGG